MGLIATINKDNNLSKKYLLEASTIAGRYNIASGWEAYYQLGLVYFQQKNFDSSVVYIKKAANQLDKNNENLYGGESARKIYNNDPRKAFCRPVICIHRRFWV